MVNSLSRTLKPNNILSAASNVVNTQKTDRITKLFKNEKFGKFLEATNKNGPLINSLFSLAVCVALRPVTNFLVTKDKEDAAYASGHSISSGVIGALWTLAIATPIATGMAAILKKPQKFLKPELIKQFYPNVGTKEVVKNGKKTLEVMTDKAGNLLRQDGKLLCRSNEPLKIEFGEAAGNIAELEKQIAKTKKPKKLDSLNQEKLALEEKLKKFQENKATFEKAHPDLYVDSNGVVRSRKVFKTKNGKFQLDKDGNKIGCIVQEDLTPVTEEMEFGKNRETNITSMVNWSSDVFLAPVRALLTIACIPPILKNVFHLEKGKKKGGNNSIPQANIHNQMLKTTSFKAFQNKLQSGTSAVKSSSVAFKGNPLSAKNLIKFTEKTSGVTSAFSKGYKYFTEEIIAKHLIAPFMNSKLASKLADKTSKVENISGKMVNIGAAATSGTYALTTLTNKKMDKKPARTLALNQVLVFITSLIGANTINKKLEKFTKNMSYKFSDVNHNLPSAELAKRMGGFKLAQKLLTFSLMYRYVSPVIITPIASKIGKALNNHSEVTDKKNMKTKKK